MNLKYMKVITRKRLRNNFSFGKESDKTKPFAKKSYNLFTLIDQTDELLSRGYDFVEPIYMVIEVDDEERPKSCTRQEPGSLRRPYRDTLAFKENMYFEALMKRI
ncbi:hypothetical protein [Bacillus cereus group sp. BfR-BA-01494]|uniref:hypothetical protein n=1 Tax=Bacillus cereus group sp. BfR-BA-01494 TaxID=2920362 RepID=UPI001F5A79D3